MNRLDKVRLLNQQSYHVAAEAFDRSRQSLWPEVRAVVAEIAPGSEVLDLGCGNGRVLNGLTDVNIHYTGIDMSQPLLERARQLYPQHTFVQAELPMYDLGRQRYDWIVGIAFFHHLLTPADRLRQLHNIEQALKSQGQLLLTVWNLWQWRYALTFFQQWRLKLAWNDCFIRWSHGLRQPVWRYYHAFTAGELRRLLRHSGLSCQSLQKHGHNYIIRAKKL